MVEPLKASSAVDAGVGEALRAALRTPSTVLAVRVVEGLHMLALRHLAGGAAAIEAALAAHDLAPLPGPGSCHGADPWLAWTGPIECLLLTSHGVIAEALLQALGPGRESLAFAVDQSAGCLAFELLVQGVDDVLPRLLDASAIPHRAGQSARARWMDISAAVMRLAPDRVLLVVDRKHGIYAAQCMAHAQIKRLYPQSDRRDE